jgi:fused-like protein
VKDSPIYRSGLSPLGVVWTLSAFISLPSWNPGGVLRELLYKREQLNLLAELLSDTYFKAVAA